MRFERVEEWGKLAEVVDRWRQWWIDLEKAEGWIKLAEVIVRGSLG
jgi:hypothetical protein